MQLKNVNRVRKKRPDGTYVTYYYAWKGGPRLDGEPGSQAFSRSYFEAYEGREGDRRDCTFDSVIDDYMSSKEYLNLSPRSAKDYRKYIDDIREEFGAMPLAGFEHDASRGDFLEWRDELAVSSRRGADYAWTVLRRVVTWAHDRRKIKANPCTRAGRVYEGAQRVDAIWTDEHEAAFEKVASAQVWLAFSIAVWTGQRQGDILALDWKSYDGTHLRLRQQKTKRFVVVKVGEPLRRLLNETLAKKFYQKVGPEISVVDLRAMHGEKVVQSQNGRPFTSYGFSCSFRRAKERAGVKGLTFHDLRGTTVTRLAEMGATDIEIAAVTGHSIADVKSILDSHYLSRTQRLSDNAIDRLERRVKNSQLPPNSQKRGEAKELTD